MPRVTDPSVAIIMFTGSVGSHLEGVLNVGISLTSLCLCCGSALIQHPMLDVYGTKGGRSNVGRRAILHLPVIATNRVLVFVSTTCVARAGRAQSEKEDWIYYPWYSKKNQKSLCPDSNQLG
jgi:hypothetical protein